MNCKIGASTLELGQARHQVSPINSYFGIPPRLIAFPQLKLGPIWSILALFLRVFASFIFYERGGEKEPQRKNTPPRINELPRYQTQCCGLVARALISVITGLQAYEGKRPGDSQIC